MVRKRNRKGANNRPRRRADTEVKAPRTMAPFRFRCPNVLDCVRRFCVVVWSGRSAFFAITGLFGFLAITFRKRGERGGVGGPEAGEESDTPKGTIPRETDEPLTVVCHETPAEPGREPAAEKDEDEEVKKEEVEVKEEEVGDSRDDRVDVSDELYCDYDSTWETNYVGTRETNRGSLRPRVSSYVSNQRLLLYVHNIPVICWCT